MKYFLFLVMLLFFIALFTNNEVNAVPAYKYKISYFATPKCPSGYMAGCYLDGSECNFSPRQCYSLPDPNY